MPCLQLRWGLPPTRPPAELTRAGVKVVGPPLPSAATRGRMRSAGGFLQAWSPAGPMGLAGRASGGPSAVSRLAVGLALPCRAVLVFRVRNRQSSS